MSERMARFTDWDEPANVTVTRPPQCSVCKHLRERGRATCNAFPAGIPAVILTGKFDHTEPYPGDNGVRFEPRTEQ